MGSISSGGNESGLRAFQNALLTNYYEQMARAKSPTEAQILSNHIQSWATAHGAEGDIYLSQLKIALDERKNWPMWASLDPLQFLPNPELTGQTRLNRLNFILTAIRNGLVFTPVALTWLAISKATAAFAVFSTKNPNGVANFLDFWEKGYGILDKAWSIGNVAFFDFLIILMIISMTLATTILGRRIQEARELSLSKIDHERTALALDISEFFFDKQRVTNVTMNQGLAKAIRDLMNATEAVSKSASELNKTVKALPSYKELISEIKNIKLNIISKLRSPE